MSLSRTQRPLTKLIQGSIECSPQASAYGKCVASKAEEIVKDMCASEFRAFKDCVQKVAKRKW